MNDLISRSAVLSVGNVRKVTEYDEAGFGMTYHAVPVEAIKKIEAIDAVPVVRCKACVLHGHCIVEDMFILSGFADGYCRAGKRVSNVVSGARMDGDADA